MHLRLSMMNPYRIPETVPNNIAKHVCGLVIVSDAGFGVSDRLETGARHGFYCPMYSTSNGQFEGYATIQGALSKMCAGEIFPAISLQAMPA